MSLPVFVVKEVPGAVVGLVVGSFIPSPLRVVKAFIVSIARKIVAKAGAEAKVVESDIKAKV